MRILISNSLEDKSFVDQLVRDIYRELPTSLQIFRIPDPRPDEVPARKLRAAFESAHATLLILSPAYLGSSRGSLFIETGASFYHPYDPRLIVVIAEPCDVPRTLREFPIFDQTEEYRPKPLIKAIRTALSSREAAAFSAGAATFDEVLIERPDDIDRPVNPLVRGLSLGVAGCAVAYFLILILYSTLGQDFPAILLVAAPWAFTIGLTFLVFAALYGQHVPLVSSRLPPRFTRLLAPLFAVYLGGLVWQSGVAQTLAYPYASEVHTVFFATDRAPTSKGDPALFSRDPSADGKVSYGSARIYAPWKQETNVRLIFWRSQHDVPQQPLIGDVKQLSSEEFMRTLWDVVSKSQQRAAFLFVHGFRVPFVDALRATGQLARDLKFDGAPILFSWPAGAAIPEYVQDYDNANWAVEHLEQFLSDILKEVRPEHFQLIAHSMGTRVLTLAVHALRNQPSLPEKPFENIVLAAADLDPPIFQQTSPTLRSLSHRVTLYVCQCDWALTSSKEVHDGPRVGMTKGSYPGMDVMDAGTLDHAVININHSYLLEDQIVLYDLFQLINFDQSPPHRAAVERDGCCWVFTKR